MVAPEFGAVAEYAAPTGDTWGSEWPGAAAPAAAVEGQAGAEWTAAGLNALLYFLKAKLY
jgi:small subunit ribosomal protein SAe